MAVAAGDDDHVIIRGELYLPDRVFKAVADHLVRQRQALVIGKVGPVVGDDDVKAALGRKLRHMQRDMPAAQHQKPLLREHRLCDCKCTVRFPQRDLCAQAPFCVGLRYDRDKRARHILCYHAGFSLDLCLQRDSLPAFEL